MQQISATGGAFAACLADGQVVTWGDLDFGGDDEIHGDDVGWLVGISYDGWHYLEDHPRIWSYGAPINDLING